MKIQNNELRFKVFQPQENKPKSGYDGYLADLELECLNMKEIEGLVDTMGLDADTEFLLAKVLEVEALVRSIEQEMEALRQRELGRICKEFSANSYGERFGVGIETVVSVVVGKENLPGAMKLVGEKLRRYEEGIRRCRNYDSFARKVNAG